MARPLFWRLGGKKVIEIEQEIASIMKFLIDQTKVVPYYWKIPSNFVVPSIYFPMPEIDTDGETFLTYAMEYSWYIKIFHEKEEDAYSLGLMAVTKIRAARNLIPLILEDGSKIKGSWIRVNDPKLKILDDGSAQLTLNWRSRRPYNDTLEEVQHSQSFNVDMFMKSGKEISDTYAEALEKYAVILN